MFTVSTYVCKPCMSMQSWHIECYVHGASHMNIMTVVCIYALDTLSAVRDNKLVMWHVLYITVHACRNLALSTFFEAAVVWSSHSAQSRLYRKIQFITCKVSYSVPMVWCGVVWCGVVWCGMEILFHLGKPLAMKLLFKAHTEQYRHKQ